MMKVFLKQFFFCMLMLGAISCDRDLDYATTESIHAVIPGAYAMIDFSTEIRCELSSDSEYRFYSSSDYGAQGVYAQLDKGDVPLLVFLGVDDKGSVNISFFSFKEVKKKDYEKIKALLMKHFSVVMPEYGLLSEVEPPSAKMIEVFKETGANARKSYEEKNCN